MSSEQRSECLLLAVLAALLLTIWAQPAGAPLIDHDETRYAEIAREMLVSGDYAVPHLNGMVWYEKPPLLFWAEAASMRVFGVSPWGARFPTRAAGMGTILLLYLFVRHASDRRRALLAALIAAGTPLAWGIAFLNLTDGLLTFFMVAAILAGYAAMEQTSRGPFVAFAIASGAASGFGFLAKGLIAVVFPAAILGIWAAITHQSRRFVRAALMALASLAAIVMPWMASVWARSPDYLTFFLLRENVQRYTSAIHDRQEPVFFSATVFAIALLPVLGLFVGALVRRRPVFTAVEKLLLVWFSFIVLFFSFSRSQLPAYIAPAIPAAAALIALRFHVFRASWASWALQALAMSLLVGAVFANPRLTFTLLDPSVRALAITASLAILATSWLAFVIARKDEWTAIAVTFAGCAIVYATLVAGWPRSVTAREMAALRDEIQLARAEGGHEIVSYHTFLKGLPWLLKEPVPFVDAGGELAYGSAARRNPNAALAWPEGRFWSSWRGGRPLLVLLKEEDIPSFEERAGGVPFIVGRARHHLLVSNHPFSSLPDKDPRTSTALYSAPLDADSIAVPLASVPVRIMTSARKQLNGQNIVRSVLERTDRGYVYELIAGGPLPRLVEIDLNGNLVYTEEIVDETQVPPGAMALAHRAVPDGSVAFVKRERRQHPSLDRFHIFFSGRPGNRTVEVDTVVSRLVDPRPTV